MAFCSLRLYLYQNIICKAILIYFFPFCLFRSKRNDHTHFLTFTTKQYPKPTKN